LPIAAASSDASCPKRNSPYLSIPDDDSRGSGPIVLPRSGGHASLKSDGAVAGVWIAGMNRGLWIARQSRLGQGQPGTPVPDRASQADPHRNTVPTRPSQTDTW